MRQRKVNIFILILCISLVPSAIAQQDIAQQAYNIFQQSCLNCHGEHGAFTEEIIIEYTTLIKTGAVVPENPDASELYKRLVEEQVEKRMPLRQPPLSDNAIQTIRQWIEAGAPDWGEPPPTASAFITPGNMLETIKTHVDSLSPFDRFFARYFTMTHLYNAGDSDEALIAMRLALSKLINSLSWGSEIINPQPIDTEHTLFYIDLRDYEWDIQGDAWAHIEQVYPYPYNFRLPIYETLRQDLDCEVPVIHVDWFLANASRPPLYHDILRLPETAHALEQHLGVDVERNLQNAAGRRVWRAGFNNSGVSNHNRVVERHLSRYGAYWKSYDFAGSAGKQHIFTHPLDFTHDGGEIVFNLPNGLQAYYLSDAAGNRLDVAPIQIVRNPAADDPTVRNGISCIGCHTEGMKTFEDEVRAAIEQNPNPLFDKIHALRLYIEKETMETLVQEDTDRYKTALKKTGGTLGGIEPVQRFHEVFWGPIDADHAAAAIGLGTEAFLEQIHEKPILQNLGLSSLTDPNGTVKRDTWTRHFGEIVFALHGEDKTTFTPPDITQITPTLDGSVHIPDSNLRAAITEALGKAPLSPITPEELAQLTRLEANNREISDLTGLEHAVNLERLYIDGNLVTDISPLAKLVNLRELQSYGNRISDVTPLTQLTKLDFVSLGGGQVSDLTAYAELKFVKRLWLGNNDISDVSPLAGLTNLRELYLHENNISDVSPLAGLRQLEHLELQNNLISDFSPLERLAERTTILRYGNPGFGGRKINGPWLWLFLPDTRLDPNTDLLAEVSGGKGSELKVATKGATEGKAVGNSIWIAGTITPSGLNNINDMLNKLGVGTDSNDNSVVYGSITFNVPRQQRTNLYIGGNGAVKVWLNGQKVFQKFDEFPSKDYHDAFSIGLNSGTNVLLVASDNRSDWWSLFVGFEPGLDYTVNLPGTPFTQNTSPSDVNADGIVNILDLVAVAQYLGETQPVNPRVDVNADGTVNILDLVLVAQQLGASTTSTSPSILATDSMNRPDPALVQAWIERAQLENDGSLAFQQGIANLQRLLALLRPEETALLPNYPNPFNPETWIPYQLSKPADVVLNIYAVDGSLVRNLPLGYQPAGIYQNRARAAYWDGKNNFGESVANGIYFYTLTADDFTATRKMLIRK